MWAGVELSEIEAFLLVAEELHFGRTAQRMGFSPARVSQLIQRLERRVGGRLVARTNRVVSLTPLGRMLAVDLAAAREAMDAGLRAAGRQTQGMAAVLRVGHAAWVENVAAVGTLIDEFELSAAATRVARLRIDQFDYVHALRSGELDVALTWWPCPLVDEDSSEGLRCGPPIAVTGRVVLVCPPHPLAHRTEVSLDELADHPVLNFPSSWGPSMLHDRWLPTHTPSGRVIPRRELPSSFRTFRRELAARLVRGEDTYMTLAPFLGIMSMPPQIRAVPVTDAEPMALVPWWLTAAESPTIRVFVDTITSNPPRLGIQLR